MATLVLGAAGAAIGGSLGGSVLGLSSAVIGKAVGSTLGRVVDQKVLGTGSAVVEHGRIDRFRLSGAAEGASVPELFGSVRLSGQIIWSTNFKESKTTTSGGGKGAPSGPSSTQLSYSVSLAVAICEGPIDRIGRIWADGMALRGSDYVWRIYNGDDQQACDPLIQAVEGIDAAPAYRGTAYVVFENLPLADFGNRVPHFSFEVVRSAKPDAIKYDAALSSLLRGVALIPGTGEYSLATSPVFLEDDLGESQAVNLNSTTGLTDFENSLESLVAEVGSLKSVLLVSSWFGDDLRTSHCQIRPKVEQSTRDSLEMPWTVAGMGRSSAEVLSQSDGRSVYGGTPCDRSLIEAIQRLNEHGKAIVFYPFLLMEILAENEKPDPWTGETGQPILPWRGRITSQDGPMMQGRTEETADVRTFFGNSKASDFAISEGAVSYTGNEDWGYRRFVLHQAAVCAAAGGVDAFCIGSEMRSLTQIIGPDLTFPAVSELIDLLQEVRMLLPNAKLGYAADWSEYFGFHDNSGNVHFHLDPLWASAELDFIGIDNYMPLTDWRGTEGELDSDFGSIYNPDYLARGIEGGEGYDWYYASDDARQRQDRTLIADSAHGEDWIFRYKDIRNWWSNQHHNRIDGVRSELPTEWVPESKPIWFTEIGCAAIDKGTNQPNKFLDPKSSESDLPHFSNGRRDDFLQQRYLSSLISYWGDEELNPISTVFDGRMIDCDRTHVWAYDTRPWPDFPARSDVWDDADNYDRGHWLNGRISAQPLSLVIGALCEEAGLFSYDVSAVEGVVRGYEINSVGSGRSKLQPLLMAYGVQVVEADGKLVFSMKAKAKRWQVRETDLVQPSDGRPVLAREFSGPQEVPGKLQLSFVEHGSSYQLRVAEAIWSAEGNNSVSQSELPLVLTQTEGREIAERWQAEARISRDAVTFALPPSASHIGVGDVIDFISEDGTSEQFRVERIEESDVRVVEAEKTELSVFEPSSPVKGVIKTPPVNLPSPVFTQIMDLPIVIEGDTSLGAFIAGSASPWVGKAAVYRSMQDHDYTFKTTLDQPATLGRTLDALPRASAAVWQTGQRLRVRVSGGKLSSATKQSVLNGANACAIGDGSTALWEIFQFQTAELVADGIYELSGFLRGQNGTDEHALTPWPEGSLLVFLDDAIKKVAIETDQRGLEMFYLTGPAARTFDDPIFRKHAAVIEGASLKPFSPVHLKVETRTDNSMHVGWVRRTRQNGDSWMGLDVPLSESSEHYLVRFTRNDALISEVIVNEPSLVLTPEQVGEFGLSANDVVNVAQVSDLYGPGSWAKKVIV